MRKADPRGACLDGADLTGADLARCSFVGASIAAARLDGCRVCGTSAWKLVGEPAASNDLVATPSGEPVLLIENAGLRGVIDTLTAKSALLPGRFTPERKATPDALRRAPRAAGYSPLILDFDKPTSKTMTDTVRRIVSVLAS